MRYWKSDCNRKCCGTCEYYTGKRTVSTGFYGDEVEVDVENEGLCSKQWKSPKVKEYNSCFSYEKSKDIEVAQKQVELKEFKRKQAQQQKENEKKLKEIEKQRNRVSANSGIDTTSTTSNSSSHSSSKTGFLFGGIGVAIIAIVVIITTIVNAFTPKQPEIHTNTLTGQNKVIAEYIVANGERDEKYNDYSIQKNISVNGKNYEFQIRYFNKENESTNFVTYITYRGGSGDDYKYYEGILYFNYGEKSSLRVSGVASYEGGWFSVYYNGVSYNTCPNMSYERTQISNLSNLEVTNEMKDNSISGIWECIEVCASATNDFIKAINSSYRLW